MNNPFEDVNKEIKKLKDSAVSIKVGTVTSASPFQVKFDGESTSATYLMPKNYTPTVNDRVYFLVASGKYVCLGAYS